MTIKSVCPVLVFFTACIPAASNAALITDFVDPPDTVITLGSTPSPCPPGFTCNTSVLSFVHDITAHGFVAGVDSVSTATLAIHLTDARGGGHESYEIDVGADQTYASINVPSGGGGSVDTFALTVPSIADLNADGRITVRVEALGGTFSFGDSLLAVNDPPVNLPEPGALALFGLVFAGMGIGARNVREKRGAQHTVGRVLAGTRDGSDVKT